jgi:hypothetical protein
MVDNDGIEQVVLGISGNAGFSADTAGVSGKGED